MDLWISGNYIEDLIPFPVKLWPGKGNPFFESFFGFELPDTPQGLADFWDENGDGIYNPLDGDHPALLQRGCDARVIPDEMIFWIFNDAAGAHSQTLGEPMQMEFQVTAFGFDQDHFEYSTFYKYKLINRGPETLSDAYFGMWVDPDLGCHIDDAIGSDSLRNMWFLYNKGNMDGEENCTCPDGVIPYCEEIPMLGMDIIRGPLDENGDELGMSSFAYYQSWPTISFPAATTEPQTPEEFYNYLKGLWRDGSPITASGSGYQTSNQTICCAYPRSNPNIFGPCDSLPDSDRKIIQATGPMTFLSGATNELILGVVYVPDIEYPCPNIAELNRADDIIQAVFDDCISVLTSVENTQEEPVNDIIIAPNPFSKTNHTELNISNLPQKSTIRIFDINGKIVKNFGQVTGHSISWTPKFSLSGGVYFVAVSDNNERKVLKWVYSK